ncbi:hypothetical protein G7046_g684 [Stylonectria norvegica]|nr:hypothetical protein G7046_g684 [Stylonectria norvegica]
MVKMLSPGFPPRRPSGYIRYALLVGVLLLLFYTFRNTQPETRPLGSYPDSKLSPGLPVPASPPPQSNLDLPPKANDLLSVPNLHPKPVSPIALSDEDDESSSISTVSATAASRASESEASTSSSTTSSSAKTDSTEVADAKIKVEDPTPKDPNINSNDALEQIVEKPPIKKPGKPAPQKQIPIVDDSEAKDGSETKEDSKAKGDTKAKGDSKAKEDSKTAGSSSFSTNPEDGHPIDKLIYDAQLEFAATISKESKTLEQAAQAYRKRRGRHPPPGFEKWFQFATDNKAVIVEDFFDQVYHDLEPFWGMPPAVLRKESWDFEMTIHIRNGTASSGSDWFWTKIWLNMISTIEHLLPDMDLALNAMDEPRLVVPWEDINGYMKTAAKTRGFPKAKDVITEFQELEDPGKGDTDIVTRNKGFENIQPYWLVARRGCAPDSEARKAPLQKTFENPPEIDQSMADAHSYEGYVLNYTLSNDICHQPDLQGLEGILISPLSCSATKVMFPMFGGSKLTVNNEILLPAPMYWNEEERFTGGDDHGIAWKDKGDKVIWRGVATGGRNTEHNWRGFQRHRFVAMNNGTQVARVEAKKEEPENWALPPKGYKLQAQEENRLGEWVDEWADVSFIDLMCSPVTGNGQCNYTAPFFHTTRGLKMAEQFDYKILPDIDGNSFSGRYLGFLRSTSLPVKATIWREWHDSRLVPWKHFVPMDSRFGDFYGIMEYFLGYNGKGSHDAAAEKMASEGKEWAEQVLRKEDMQIYVLRLLLEYARLLDDKRDNLGWVDDVKKDPKVADAWKNY